jgi:hypothetical protein
MLLCYRCHAVFKLPLLLLSSCHCRQDCRHHCQAAAAATTMLPLPMPCCCHCQNCSVVATNNALLPSCCRRRRHLCFHRHHHCCHRCHFCRIAATAFSCLFIVVCAPAIAVAANVFIDTTAAHGNSLAAVDAVAFRALRVNLQKIP